MKERPESLIFPDIPIRDKSEDLFSFAAFAKKVASHLLSYRGSESFVIGVSGSWGSGKTSLLHLLEKELTEQSSHKHDSSKPVIFWYSPWLIGNRTALLADFLLFICSKLVSETRGECWIINYFAKAKNQYWDYRNFRKYAKAISESDKRSDFVERVTNSVGIPIISDIWDLLKSSVKVIRLKPDVTNLDELRNSASVALEKQKQRIIVVIDDLDRLEPEEIIAIFRLVRSTALLPNITYVLSFDADQIVNLLQNRPSAKNPSFTDKIFQLVVSVPQIEQKFLRSYLQENLNNIIKASLTEVLDDETRAKRMSFALKEISNLSILKTPRDVNRLINSFALGIQGVEPSVIELSDLLLRCAIQLKFPNVYEWIYRYSETTLSESFPVIEEATKNIYLKRLLSACDADCIEVSNLEGTLQQLIPNINWSFSQ